MTELLFNTVQLRFPAGSSRTSCMEIANFMKRLGTDVMLTAICLFIWEVRKGTNVDGGYQCAVLPLI